MTDAVKSILVEHDYVDKDYRSTLYSFYAKKGRNYRRDCVRLHFFNDLVRFDKKRTDLVCEYGVPNDHYYGYIVLRPTMKATLGRSVLTPGIRVGAGGRAIQSQHRVNVLGYPLTVWGFPSMEQPADIAVCAHVSCWAILRYYSERFPQCREYLIGDMARLASPFDPGGLVPSLGLTVWQAERVFQAAGCFPVVVAKNALTARRGNWRSGGRGREVLPRASCIPGVRTSAVRGNKKPAACCRPCGVRLAQKECRSSAKAFARVGTGGHVVMVDDNRLPYRSVAASASSTLAGSLGYSGEDFDKFIVALPEKIHFPAPAVDVLSKRLATVLMQGFLVPEERVQIRRYFMTTISELRNEVRKRASQRGLYRIVPKPSSRSALPGDCARPT